ncbi:hypothetical protein E5Q_05677 [Mixia osmundae IAM 14324]|uniref:Uncharacterized protein n=1 Tax=Mixia osmundae (strain CBS 9802 / IAM 14324 / JCM 22182 / KY 12970) TaxID=764103 RepID=G7E828_MIXOS|nr:hypothetical protein E5Q_05677 [Mixia osmundae IAM 14324]
MRSSFDRLVDHAVNAEALSLRYKTEGTMRWATKRHLDVVLDGA